ncbi:hypothetical protein LJR098_000160 [Rhizobium sp. LjRoot98]|uniref:hypothetical protein n=1 Tax=unclassified Rhizobium TaxID=2613769 RepID=UPI000713EA14|nr:MULTISPECIES: hypothetical protein [unclassified Rhizobium]KQV40698.1 hypothetical protein ASC96_19710 [Rhizobium sp. Root1204]KQY17123.1 hypothetical protein ASD36_00185 [Rhizobium sp. Root1334]KRC13020.1 hypothetical protein ASE23_00180 [Rhizobium sp. Root73]
MAFKILVRNEGATAIYAVDQQIDPAIRKLVFEDMLQKGDEVWVDAHYTEDDEDSKGTFIWRRTGASDYVKEIWADGTLIVE